jgi:hypothetical protein
MIALAPLTLPYLGDSMFFKLRAIVCLLLISAALAVRPALAQGLPNAAILSREAAPSTKVHLKVKTPGGTAPKEITAFERPIVDVTQDLQWWAAQGYDPKTQGDLLVYGNLDGGSTQIPIEAGYNAISAKLDPKGRYLSYTLASNTAHQWILGLVNLSDGKRAAVTAPLTFDIKPDAFAGAASAVGWSVDGRYMILRAFLPFTEGIVSGGIYSLDISGAKFDGSRQPLPTLNQLVQAGLTVTQIEISPDSSRLAYLFFNPANPPVSYNSASPFGVTMNALAIFDLKASKPLFVAEAGKGQGFEVMTWTPDSAKILVTAGSYKDTNYLVQPHVFTVDIAKVQVTDGPIAYVDTAYTVDAMLACGDTLFYRVTSVNGEKLTVFLVTAPLADLKTQSEKQSVGETFRFATCTTRS